MSNSRMGNVWKYVLPAMLSHVCFSLFSIVDGVFVGNGVGTNALGAIGLVMPFVNAICALMMLINVGGATIFAVQVGKKDTASANDIFRHGMLLLVGVSVVFTIAGVFFRVTLSVDISGFECCKNGKKIKMLSLAGTLTGEAVTGKAFKGKVRARNSKGSKCRDKKTGRFVKCPENGWTQGIVVGDFIEDPDVCPVPYVGFSASIVGNVTAGAYVAGVTAEFDFPIYPNIEVPSLSFGYSKGTAGFEVSLGVSGELFAVIYENETVNLSI